MNIALIGEDVLKQQAKAVTQFDEPSLVEFIHCLKSKMLDANGIGIAAPQVFDERAIMIIASRANERYPDAPNMAPLVMINPIIKSQYGELEKQWEGCLSIPGLRGLVPRHHSVDIRYQDVHGQSHELSWHGFLARIFLHEYDHLIGKLWLDRVESTADSMSEQLYFKKVQQ